MYTFIIWHVQHCTKNEFVFFSKQKIFKQKNIETNFRLKNIIA